MKDLTDREFRIKQALEKKGWTIQWRGVPANRWLWASKHKNAKRYISVEMTTDVGEIKEALAENQPDD
jgi:hypothetical protein